MLLDCHSDVRKNLGLMYDECLEPERVIVTLMISNTNV